VETDVGQAWCSRAERADVLHQEAVVGLLHRVGHARSGFPEPPEEAELSSGPDRLDDLLAVGGALGGGAARAGVEDDDRVLVGVPPDAALTGTDGGRDFAVGSSAVVLANEQTPSIARPPSDEEAPRLLPGAECPQLFVL